MKKALIVKLSALLPLLAILIPAAAVVGQKKPVALPEKETVAATVSQTPADKPAGEVSADGADSDRLPFMQREREPELAAGPGTATLLFKTLGAMILIIGLIFAGSWTLKKLGYGGIGPAAADEDVPELIVLSKASPASGQLLSVVRFGKRTLLIGSTSQSFTLLAEAETGPGEEGGAAVRSVADLLAAEEDERSAAEKKNGLFAERFERARRGLNRMAKNGGAG